MFRDNTTLALRLATRLGLGATEIDLGPTPPGPNAHAFAATCAELLARGHLNITHEALVTAGATLAHALDDRPDATDLWREYRSVVAQLTAGLDDDADEGGSAADRLVAALHELNQRRLQAG